MAINQAIIRIRRGLKEELQIDKLLPGELAMATNAPIMWFCWSPGEVEQIPTNENIGEVIEEITKKYLSEYAKKTDIPTKTSQLQNDSNFLTEHQDLSGYAEKATSLAGYGITDGATKEEFNQLSQEIEDVEETVENVKTDIYLCPSVLKYVEPVFGHIADGGHIQDNNNKNICFKYKVFASKGSTISVDYGYKYQIALFGSTDDAYIKRVTWLNSDTVYTLESDAFVIVEISNEAESVLEDFSIYKHLKCNLIQKKDSIPFVRNANIPIVGDIGSKIDIIEKSHTLWRYAIINCHEGDVFTLNAKGGYKPKLYCFVDKNNMIIDVSASNLAEVLVENYKVVAPKNASKIIINDYNSLGCFCYAKNRIDTNRDKIADVSDRIDELEKNKIINNLYEVFGESIFIDKTLNVIKPNRYNCWPFVGIVGNKLVCLYSKGSNHTDSGFDVYSIVSENGVVWSEPTLIFGTPNVRENITGKGRNSVGDLIVWLRKSSPNGQTVFELHKTEDCVSYSKVSEMSIDNSFAHIGDIIWQPFTTTLTAFYNTYGDVREWGVLRSTDDGKTWTRTPIETGVSISECPLEISGTYLSDGKMLAIGRNDNGQNAKLFQLESTNYGSSWSKHSTNIDDTYQSTPSLCNVDGELTLFYYHRGTGYLRMRKNKYADVWNKYEWNESKIVARGAKDALNAGNVNATVWNDYLIASFYSGGSENTGIYNVIINSK